MRNARLVVREAKRLARVLHPSAGDLARRRFAVKLISADWQFQRGKFPAAARRLREAAALQQDQTHQHRIAASGPFATREAIFAGSEIMNPIGHQSARLGVQTMALDLFREHEPPILLETGIEANPYLVSCWRFPFKVVRLSQENRALLERGSWYRIGSVQWMYINGCWEHLYAATAKLEAEWKDNGFSPVLIPSAPVQQAWSDLCSRHGLAQHEPIAVLHVRGNGSGSSYGRNSSIESATDLVPALLQRGLRPVWLAEQGVPYPGDKKGVIDLSKLNHLRGAVDLAVMANARIFIGAPSGPLSTAHYFGTPSVVMGTTGLGFWPWMDQVLHVPRPILDRSGKRITMEEICEKGLWFYDGNLPNKSCQGFTWGPVDARDVKAAVVECIGNDTWGRANKLQAKFDAFRKIAVPYKAPTLSERSLEAYTA